jgi:hypothetical protein
MENINKQFEQLYTLLELTDFQADLIKKLQNDVNTALRQPPVIGQLCRFCKKNQAVVNEMCYPCRKDIGWG